jgi:hypothetical protein
MITVREATNADVESMLPLYIELHEFTASGLPSRLMVPNT